MALKRPAMYFCKTCNRLLEIDLQDINDYWLDTPACGTEAYNHYIKAHGLTKEKALIAKYAEVTARSAL